MISNFKLILMKIVGVALVATLCLELKVISLKNQKELEKESKIKANNEKESSESKNGILEFLSLENEFNLSKLENYDVNSWSGNINFNESLEEGIKKVESLTKKDFTIENYKVEYKDGYGNFNLKVRAGD